MLKGGSWLYDDDGAIDNGGRSDIRSDLLSRVSASHVSRTFSTSAAVGGSAEILHETNHAGWSYLLHQSTSGASSMHPSTSPMSSGVSSLTSASDSTSSHLSDVGAPTSSHPQHLDGRAALSTPRSLPLSGEIVQRLAAEYCCSPPPPPGEQVVADSRGGDGHDLPKENCDEDHSGDSSS